MHYVNFFLYLLKVAVLLFTWRDSSL